MPRPQKEGVSEKYKKWLSDIGHYSISPTNPNNIALTQFKLQQEKGAKDPLKGMFKYYEPLRGDLE